MQKIKLSKKEEIVPIIQKKSKKFFLEPTQGTIDYKNVILLRKFITAEGKILPRRLSGLTAKQQRYMTNAIKNARIMSLLPFISQSKPTS
uniref:Small ribosomal subunit protein bS18c n=1 Tax=Microthamnion kuetzingianum TaxID=34148 RepID=A0A097KNH2_9CHLO|nr:ribosomal protein S18 [Microthamnion kuetzingianum]AIT94722.1 ribosomal protein S18 [Microthamnion kuetzingianum]